MRIPARLEGIPRDRRGYPIIASVSREGDTVDFGSLSERRKLVLATFDLCAVCGMPFGRDTRWQVTMVSDGTDDDRVFSEGPVHEICALYAAQVCPFVSSPYARLGDQFRRGMKRPDEVYLIGYGRTSAVYGQNSMLQPGTGVLHFGMADKVGCRSLRTASDAAALYERALEEDVVNALDTEEHTLVEILHNPTPDGEDSAGVLAGAAWYVGGAFCPASATFRPCPPTSITGPTPTSLLPPSTATRPPTTSARARTPLPGPRCPGCSPVPNCRRFCAAGAREGAVASGRPGSRRPQRPWIAGPVGRPPRRHDGAIADANRQSA